VRWPRITIRFFLRAITAKASVCYTDILRSSSLASYRDYSRQPPQAAPGRRSEVRRLTWGPISSIPPSTYALRYVFHTQQQGKIDYLGKLSRLLATRGRISFAWARAPIPASRRSSSWTPYWQWHLGSCIASTRALGASQFLMVHCAPKTTMTFVCKPYKHLIIVRRAPP